MQIDFDTLPDYDELTALGMSDQDIAFELWALFADQNARETTRLLNDCYGLALKYDTVKKWVSRYNWKIRLPEKLDQFVPAQRQRAAMKLASGVDDAAGYLVAVVRGEEEPNRDRVNAATVILDRLGFLPHTRREAVHTGINAVSRGAGGDLAELGMTDEELQLAIAGHSLRFNETVTVDADGVIVSDGGS